MNIVKKILLPIVLIYIQSSNYELRAQTYNETYKQAPYIGFGLGVNDYGLGAGLEIPVSNKIAIYCNAGVGGWGYKLSAGLSFFPRQVHFGPAFNIGYAFASGLKDLETELGVNPNNTSQKVLLDLKKANTVNLFYSYSWTLRRTGKFSISFGYAIPFEEKPYELKTEKIELSSSSEQIMEILQPGGLIFGLKFMFRL